METARSIALKQMAESIPGANSQVAKGMQQARLMGLQSAVAGTTTPATKSDIQAAGAQQAAAAGGIAAKAAGATVEQAGALGKVAVQAQSNAATTAATQSRTALDNLNRSNEAELAALGRGLKQDIFDRRMQFQHDDSGRAVLDASQLADWSVLKSKNHQEFEARLQDMQLASDRKMQLLSVAQKRVIQEMENVSKGRIVDMNGAYLDRLAQAKANIEAQIAAEQAAAQNRMQMWQTGGTIVGTVIGGVVGGAPGALAGGAVGGGVGTMAGSQMEQANHPNTQSGTQGSGLQSQRPT